MGDAGMTLAEVGHAYGDVRVLDCVSARFEPGRLHALLGENGAGKSTLLKIAAGLLPGSTGSVTLGGHRLDAKGAQSIAYVEQHASLFESLSVHENVALGPARRAPAAADALAAVGLPSRDASVGSLSLAERQLVLLARAIFARKQVFFLDEPTALATPLEAARLYGVLATLAHRGHVVVVVTHHVEEVLAHAAEATVLRHGVVALHAERGSASFVEDALLRAMFGAVPAALERAGAPGSVFGTLVDRKGRRIDVRRGEILGIAGMAGQGQAELVRAMRFGSGASFAWEAPVRAAALAADRHHEAMVPSASVAENAMLGAMPARGPLAFVDHEALLASARDRTEALGVKAPNLEMPIDALSGGNQQKVVLGRVLGEVAARPVMDRAVVFAEPTRGIDAAAARVVHEELARVAREGGAVVLVTSDYRELRRVADRYAVVWKHAFVGEFPAEVSDATLAAAMATGGEGSAS